MWQATLRDVTIGDDTAYRFTGTPSLFGIDNLRVNVTDKAGLHGETVTGPDLLSGIDRTFQVLIDGGNDERYALSLFRDLQAAWQPADTDLELTLITPDRTYTLFGRPRRAVPDLTLSQHGALQAALQFRQTDPLFYEAQTGFGGAMGQSIGGLAFPFGFPFAFGTVTPGMFHTTVGGNTPTWLSVAGAAGPTGMSDPIFKLATGEQLVFKGLSVPAGWVILIDWQQRTTTMTADGVNFVDIAAYIDRTVSDWWTGPGTLPNGDVTVTWVGGGGAAAFFLYRPAWIL